MQCEDVAALLLPALHDQLPPEAAGALGEHLQGCARCSHDLPRLTRAWQLLDQWPDQDVPDAARRRIAALAD
jgi:hypothetical protein